MVLQKDGAWFRSGFDRSGCGVAVAREFQVFVNDHSVVTHRHARVGYQFPIFVLGRREVDIIGLPRQGRIAHVHTRSADRVDATTLILFAIETKRIQHLDFVTTLHV